MPTETKFVCRHIFTDGRRCQSPTLRGGAGPEHFCYYHHTTRRPIPILELGNRRACREPFHLPLAADRAAIQQAIAEVLQKIAANEIDTRRASILLRGLRIATLNLPKEVPNPNPHPLGDEIVLDADYGLLAPEAKEGSTKYKGAAQLMLEKLQKQFGEDIGLPTWVPPNKRPAESHDNSHQINTLRANRGRPYSRTTALTKLRGRSTSTPFRTAIK